MIIIVVTLFSIVGMASCTNNEGDSDFDTVKPNLPGNPKKGIEIDTITVQVNALEVKKL